jgi:glycosyltransferase involved in cell wall biosynthesis
MRVLFVSSSSGSRGGGELYLVYLAEALKAKGHTVALWCSSHAMLDELAEAFSPIGDVIRSEYTNTYLRKSRSYRYLLPVSGKGRWIREWLEWKPDLIHFNKQCLEDGLDLLKASKRLSVPHCCTIHITQSARELKAKGATLRDWVARRNLRRYKRPLVAIAPTRSRELAAFLGEGVDIQCVANGVAVPKAEDQLRLRQETRRKLELDMDSGPVVVGIGRLEEQKRPLLFVRMAEQMLEVFPDARFYWIGDGRLRAAFDSAVRSAGIGDKLICVGWQKDVKPYLAAADIYLHPAGFEGLPFSLLEAMAWRLPCVIMPELAAELSFLTDEDVFVADLMTSDWVRRFASDDLRVRLSIAGRALIENQFSLEHMAEQYEQLYLTIIQRKSS